MSVSLAKKKKHVNEVQNIRQNTLDFYHNFGSAGKEATCNAGDTGDAGSVHGSGRSPREGNGNLRQYSCLKNPLDKGA